MLHYTVVDVAQLLSAYGSPFLHEQGSAGVKGGGGGGFLRFIPLRFHS